MRFGHRARKALGLNEGEETDVKEDLGDHRGEQTLVEHFFGDRFDRVEQRGR